MARESFSYHDLLRSLRNKEFSPVYFFYGEEDFLMDEATASIISAILNKGEREFNLDIVYGNETDARDVISHASSFPMMGDRRVVVVREFDKLPNKELLAAYIEHPSASSCLILQSDKPDFRKNIYISAKNHATAVGCAPLYDNQVPGWIHDRVKEQGSRIDPEASRVLAAYVGTSMREIQSELNKLYLYVGDQRPITVEDVRAAVGISRDFNIFELQKAIGSKDAGRSVAILEHILDQGEDPSKMTGMLTKYFARLWKLSDAKRKGMTSQEQTKLLGINPFYLKEYQSALAIYSLKEIETSFDYVARADVGLKSSVGDPRTIWTTLILQLVSSGEKILA